ncbi:hypothetical protein [Caldimonas sp. KR1-144]|uniref:hypothetical protein n=1 Tax=Caldimonas sp. KR1-144 TaxID=3400911 RepID=UPI003C108BA7
MSDPNNPDQPGAKNDSFLRKVVRFVANPATDWADLNTRPVEDAQQSGYAKGELKAMIERKRRNDFVRKREFDMLRKIRREGLPPDGLAGLAGSSNLDDSDPPRSADHARADAAVKAKIDEIEQQMEGETIARRTTSTMPSHPPSFYNAPTVSSALDEASAPMNLPFAPAADPAPAPADDAAEKAAALVAAPLAPTALTAAPPEPAGPPSVIDWSAPTLPGQLDGAKAAPAVAAPAPAVAAAPAKPATVRMGAQGDPFAVEVHELAHDPELDEAVISFANADFEACERAVSELIQAGGARHSHAETWLVLFDLYRATGQQMPFESLALDYAQRFGWSAPQWFSIPQLVAAEAAASAAKPSTARIEGHVGWVAPAHLDTEAVSRLRAQALQMPLPWVLDWGPLATVEPEACAQLAELLRHWSTQPISMRWIGAEHLLARLVETAPAGVRDADPVYWLLRLEVLRIINRPDQFDEVAIDYCVTYEVSPPSWEAAQCTVKLADASGVTIAPKSAVTDVSTGFVESQVLDEVGGEKTAAVELSGQLVGDIGKTLTQLESSIGDAMLVSVNCQRLIRMDFIAAGDLLNWVLARRGENRLVHFEDAHRLLALFFNAMGISEHARVKVRNI